MEPTLKRYSILTNPGSMSDMSARTHCEKMNLYSTDTSIATGSLSSHNEPPLIFKYVYFENILKRMEVNGRTVDLKSLIFFSIKTNVP